jgi:hypothetical protein
MNAAKALLTAKGISFVEGHGVKAHNIRASSKKIELSNEGVQIKAEGVLPSLAAYLGDTEGSPIHTLQELLFNLPFVHRTYCLTYQTQQDLFLPLTDCLYVFDSTSNLAYLSAYLSKDLTARRYIKKLPPALIFDTAAKDPRAIRSVATVTIKRPQVTSIADLASLAHLNQQLHPNLQHISGSQTLWYAKAVVRGPKRLERSPLTLTLAAMHRLSEICRYRPLQLASFLAGRRNWLISEFILMSPGQFLDGISCELTGHQFMVPNVRPAT